MSFGVMYALFYKTLNGAGVGDLLKADLEGPALIDCTARPRLG
jgi:hypothetical protein